MAHFQDGRSAPSSDDLVEVHISSLGWHDDDLDFLRQLTRLPTPSRSRPRRRPDRRCPILSGASQPHLSATDSIIDLTGEPEVEAEMQQAPQQLSGRRGRNPRRIGTSAATSSLPRRDGVSIDTASHNVIDLTADSPEEVQASAQTGQGQPLPRPHASPNAPQSFELHRRSLDSDREQILGISLIRDARGVTDLARGFRRVAGLFGRDPFQSDSPSLAQTLSRSFSPREATPKPPMEEYPPARAGFTRDTDIKNQDGSRVVVVCPACNEELAYEPTSTTSPSSPADGNKKRKRAAGEHHFWVLKKCGHVYCANCYENRRPTKTMPAGAGFPGPEGKKVGSFNDLQCAVEDCETKVIPKNEWVGIFL